MDRQSVDALLTGMLESAEGASDLLFISGKPPLIEVRGRLSNFALNGAESVLTPQLIEQLAGQIMNGSERLPVEFAATGSCDCSYVIENLARFRVNIFKQNGRHAIVMRKLQSEIPTLDPRLAYVRSIDHGGLQVGHRQRRNSDGFVYEQR